MNRSSSRRSKFSTLVLTTTAALGMQTLISQEAAADSVSIHLGGSAHVDAGVHINFEGVVETLATLEAGLSVGIGWGEPAPPPPPPSPTYVAYVQQAPVYVEPQPIYVEQAASPRAVAMNRWGIGAFAGSVQVDGQESGSDRGLLGRYRLSRSWAVEGEVAKTDSGDSERIDRRLGGALIWNLPVGRRLKPSLLVGAGYGQSEFGPGELHAQQGYGEIGVGLNYRLTKSLHLMADLRSGTRSSSDDVMYVAKGSVVHLEEDENYSRARISGMFFF